MPGARIPVVRVQEIWSWMRGRPLTEPALVGIDDESDMKESLAGVIAP